MFINCGIGVINIKLSEIKRCDSNDEKDKLFDKHYKEEMQLQLKKINNISTEYVLLDKCTPTADIISQIESIHELIKVILNLKVEEYLITKLG